MGYTIAVTAETQISNASSNVTGVVTLDPVTFGSASINSINYTSYPVTLTSRIAEDSTQQVDLSAYYQGTYQVAKLLVVKASRPVTVTVSGVYSNTGLQYTLPPQTYVQHLFDSRETDFAFKPLLLTINNPVASVTQPSPLPAAYPAAEVEVLVVVQESLT